MLPDRVELKNNRWKNIVRAGIAFTLPLTMSPLFDRGPVRAQTVPSDDEITLGSDPNTNTSISTSPELNSDGVTLASVSEASVSPNPLESLIPNIGAEVEGVSPAIIRPVVSRSGLNRGVLNPDGTYTLSVTGPSNIGETFASQGTSFNNLLTLKDGVLAFQVQMGGDNPLRGNVVVNFGQDANYRHRLSLGANGVFLAQRFEEGKLVSEFLRTRLDGVDLTQVQDISILKSGELTQVFMGGILKAAFSDNTPDTWNIPSFALNRGGAMKTLDGSPDLTEVTLNILSLRAFGLTDSANQPVLKQPEAKPAVLVSYRGGEPLSGINRPDFRIEPDVARLILAEKILRNNPDGTADWSTDYLDNGVVPVGIGSYHLFIDMADEVKGRNVEIASFQIRNGEWFRNQGFKQEGYDRFVSDGSDYDSINYFYRNNLQGIAQMAYRIKINDKIAGVMSFRLS